MDVATATATTTSAAKTPEADSETPTRIQPNKPLSFSNGVLKRHHSFAVAGALEPVRELVREEGQVEGEGFLGQCRYGLRRYREMGFLDSAAAVIVAKKKNGVEGQFGIGCEISVLSLEFPLQVP